MPITASGWLDSIVDRALTPLTGETTMDPTACLARIIDAIEDEDEDEVKYACEDLRTWLDKGGFPPEGYSRESAYRFLHSIRYLVSAE